MTLHKQAFIILAHKEPLQVQALMQQFQHQNLGSFFLHIDKKADKNDFEFLKSAIPNIVFTQQHNVQWGSISMLHATVDALKSVIETGEDFSHVHLLSGEDLLIKPPQALYEFFSAQNETSFLNYNKIPDQWRHRYQLYHVGAKKDRPLFRQLFYFLYKRVIYTFPFAGRKLPYNFSPYIGSQWWSISLDLAKAIVEFTNDHPGLLRFMKYVQIPDEMFFQTLIRNHLPEFKIVNNNLRCINWSNGKNSSPEYLSDKDLKRFKSEQCFFARKIDYSKNAHLYNDFSQQNQQ